MYSSIKVDESIALHQNQGYQGVSKMEKNRCYDTNIHALTLNAAKNGENSYEEVVEGADDARDSVKEVEIDKKKDEEENGGDREEAVTEDHRSFLQSLYSLSFPQSLYSLITRR